MKVSWSKIHQFNYLYSKHHAADRCDLEEGSNTTEKFQNFEIFLWCLRAKVQIPPLCSVMFAVNTTTRAASNLDFLQFCSSPGTVHQKFECVFKILSEFSNFEWIFKFWVNFQILSEFQVKHHDFSKHHGFSVEFGLNSEILKHWFGRWVVLSFKSFEIIGIKKRNDVKRGKQLFFIKT